MVMEFAEPRGRLFGPLFRWYFTKLLPRIGGLISGNRKAYEYLPCSVDRFYTPEQMTQLLQGAGFTIVEIKRLSFGVVMVYLGEKDYGSEES